MDSVLVNAAGAGLRWAGHLGVACKALIPAAGEPLLARTMRLVHRRTPGASLSVVATEPALAPLLEPYGARLVAPEPSPRPAELDQLTSGKTAWSADGRTWLLAGDVYFTESAICQIFASTHWDVQWYGRPRPGRMTGKPYGELFGVSFDRAGGARLLWHCGRVRDEHCSGNCPAATPWQVLCSMLHMPLGTQARPRHPSLVEIDDATESFDYPHDYERWQQYQAQRRSRPAAQ